MLATNRMIAMYGGGIIFREKYAMMFDEPVLLQLGWWYVAWARVSGPSSDCGSHGQATITTDDG